MWVCVCEYVRNVYECVWVSESIVWMCEFVCVCVFIWGMCVSVSVWKCMSVYKCEYVCEECVWVYECVWVHKCLSLCVYEYVRNMCECVGVYECV